MAKKRQRAKKYVTVGLEVSDHMPVFFRKKTYDIANLSDEDLKYLKQFPEEFPYLADVPKSL